jgi:hypothetical protein
MHMSCETRSRWNHLPRALFLCGFVLLAAGTATEAQAQINLGTYSAGEVWAQLPGPFTYAVDPTSPLPPGLALRFDTPPWFPPDVDAGLIGIATSPSPTPYAFNLIRDGIQVQYQIKITALTRQNNWGQPDAFVDVPVSLQLVAQNAAGPVTWAANGPLPPGLSLSPTGLVSGTPSQSGSYNINFSLHDGVDTVWHGVNLNVYDVQITTPGALPNATQGVAYSTTILATGGAGGHTFTSSNLPFGFTLSESGVLDGTPTGPGKLSFDVTATDTAGVSYSKRLSLNVIGLPRVLPRVGPYSGFFPDCAFFVPCSFGVSVTSGGVGPFTWSATGLPPGMSLKSGDGMTQWYVTPGDAEIVGVPTQLGTFNVQVTVTDAEGAQATNTFPLFVRALYLWNSMPNGTYGVPYSHAFYLIGGQPSSYAVSLDGGRLPVGLTLNGGAFSVTGTPQEMGGFTATLLFSDSAGNQLRVNQYPSIGSADSTIYIQHDGDLGTLTAGFSYGNQLQACCVPSYLWSIASGSLPPGLTFTSGGLLSGVVPSGTTGTYQFMVRVEDASNAANFAVRQFTAVVTPVSSSTGFTLPHGNVGVFYTTILSATGAVWTLEPNQYLPPGLTLIGSGEISGTPSGSGFFSFAARATVPGGHYLIRSFGISIYPAGVNPPLNLPVGPIFTRTLGSFTQQLAATGGTPPYSYAWSPGAVPIPGMRVQTTGTPLPIGFPASVGGLIGVLATPGEYSSSIRVTDSLGAFFDKAITVRVSPLNFVSQSTVVKATVGVPYSFTVQPFGGTSYTFSSTNLPPGLSIDAAGQIFGTPTTAGNFFPTITLGDLATGNSINLGITLTVDPFAITTGGVLPPGVVGTPYNVAFMAPDCTGTCTWSTFNPAGGLTINSAGILSGTPTGTTNTSFTVTVTGSNGTVSKVFSLRVIPVAPQPLALTTQTLNDTTVGNGVANALFIQGGTPPYSVSLQSGSLPPGISLQAPGESLGANQIPGFTYLAGRAMQAGFSVFTLAVTDNVGTTVSRVFTWNISALSNQYTNLPLSGTTLRYGEPYVQPLLAIGGAGVYSWTPTAAMPPGLTIDPSTGVVSGTPANTGSFTVPMQISDGSSSLFTNVTFFVSGPTGTVINFIVGANIGLTAYGNTVNVAFVPTGGTAPYTITPLTPLPPGTALVPLTTTAAGSMSLVGVATTPGVHTFTLHVQDSVGNIGVRTFTWTVAPFALLGGTALADASVGVPYSQALPTLGAAASWAVPAGTAMPPGLGVSAGGIISGTPTTPGNYSFQLVASSGGVSLSFTFNLRVSDIVLSDATLPPATFGVPYTHALSAAGGGTLTFSANGLPGGLTISTDGVISGSPEAVGSFTIQVTITGGAVTLLRRVTLVVTFENPTVLDIPMASTLIADGSVGQVFSLTLAANGGTPPYVWSVAPGSTLPAGLALVSGAGLPSSSTPGSTMLSGVPTAAGAYQFDLIVADSLGAQTRRTYQLKVSALSVFGNPPNATAGTAYSFRLAAVGGTPPYAFDKAPVSLTQDMLPPGITLSPDGLLSGTTASTGTYRFFARIEDALGQTVLRQVILNVFSPTNAQVSNTNPPDIPVGRGRFAQTLNAFTVAGPTFFTWSLVSGALPPGLALFTEAEFGELDFGQTMLAGQATTPGTYTYTLRATDVANPSRTADHTFTIRVAPMQIVSPTAFFSSAELPGGNVGEAYSAAIRMAGGTAPYSFSVSPFNPLPPGLALSSTGVLSGTPTASGNYNLAPIITDANGYTLASNVLLTVAPAGQASPLVPRLQNGIDTPSVNTPYSFPLDLQVRGGVQPLTWTVDAGSALPPGLSIVGGQNGVPAYLAGVATTPGEYEFRLVATDADGQTLTAVFETLVSNLVLGPVAAPSGTVGVPYSVALGPAGGTPPYTLQVDPTFDLPPGLTLSGGSLTGTPLSSGHFFVVVWMFDQNDNAAIRLIQITIDHPVADDAPALSVAPNPVNIYYEQGSPAPAPVPVSINLSSGSGPFSLDLAGAPWASPSAPGGTASSVVALTVDPSGLSTGTYVGFLSAAAPGSVNGSAIAPVVLTVAVAPPCSYEVNPSAGTIAAIGGAGSFGVATGGSCVWAAVPSDPTWITITAGAAGTGGGVVNYTVSANPGVDARAGTITVNSAVYSITQFGSGCAFTISPSDLSVGPLGGAALVGVNASSPLCGWTATGLGATPSAGTSSGSVLITIPPNLDPAPLELTATIAGQTLAVHQGGAACTVSLSGSSAAYGSGGGDGSVTVTTPAGCGYATAAGPNWITITSGGSGSGSGVLLYSVLPNPTTFARSGTLTIGGQPFQITQQPLACSVTLDTTNLGSPYGPGGGAGSIGVTTNGTNCSWAASSGAAWAFVTPPAGIGNGLVTVNIGSNSGSTTERATVLTVGGSAINISQAGTTCTFALQSSAASAPGGGGSGSVGVVTPAVCAWTVQSNDSWLSSSTSGSSGSASVGFVAQPNPAATPRSGTLTIAGLVFTVSQAAAPCSYSLSTPGVEVAAEGAIGDFTFTASATSCNPDVKSFAGWLHATATVAGMSGSVAYTVDTNVSGLPRIGTIQVGSQVFTVTQLASACAFSLNSYGRLFDRNGGINNSLLGSPSALGCAPDVGTTQPSFILLGTLTGPLGNIFTLSYDVLPFPTPVSPWIRRGTITFGGQIFTVKQTSW